MKKSSGKIPKKASYRECLAEARQLYAAANLSDSSDQASQLYKAALLKLDKALKIRPSSKVVLTKIELINDELEIIQREMAAERVILREEGVVINGNGDGMQADDSSDLLGEDSSSDY